MYIHESFAQQRATVRSASAPSRFAWIRAFGARMAVWFATARDYHAAAADYQALIRLPDAELERRGLSRATLARDLCEHHDRAND